MNSEMLVLKEPFLTYWSNKDPFEEIDKIVGHSYRQIQTRDTLRFELNGESYFIKIHRGETIGEILKNLSKLKMPVLGARQEYEAIEHLNKHGVDTLTVMAFGQRGNNPLTRVSFVITKDLSPAVDLSVYCSKWMTNPPSYEIKQRIISRLALMVRKMHQSGLNHRDCYLGHFFLKLPFDGSEDSLKLSIIDLHRAQIRKKVPNRWRDKDLIGLWYSAEERGFTKTDAVRFLQIYFEKNIREIIKTEYFSFLLAKYRLLSIKKHRSRNKDRNW